MLRALPALAVVAWGLIAEDLPRGQVIDRVPCSDNAEQSYALYLPSSYTPDRAWPILYCLDPGARGRAPVERFAQGAERAGFIVAGSNNSRNGPWEPVRAAITAMLADTHARFPIDDSRQYAAGFSGGARVALGWAQNGAIAGVIVCGAGFSGPGLPKTIPFRIYAAAGVDDFNYDELFRLSRELAKRGTPHRFVEFDGGHEWLPPALAAEALEFFAGRVSPQSAQPSREQDRQAERFETLCRDASSSTNADRALLLRNLIKDAERPADSSDRRIARRVIGSVFIGSIEAGRQAMTEGHHADAARSYELAILARPNNGSAWYSLASAQAATGKTKRALEALERAAANGFRDRKRIEQDPNFAGLHSQPRYKAVLDRLGR